MAPFRFPPLREFQTNALGETEQAETLEETLTEEKETDEKLTAIAGSINEQAVEEAEGGEEVQTTSGKKKSRSAA
jgi:tRNA A58 N-methylase Trm61